METTIHSLLMNRKYNIYTYIYIYLKWKSYIINVFTIMFGQVIVSLLSKVKSTYIYSETYIYSI